MCIRDRNHSLTNKVEATSAASDDRESLQRMVRDLEQQLDTLRHSEGAAQQRIHQLEEDMKNMKTLEEVRFDDNMCKTSCHTFI